MQTNSYDVPAYRFGILKVTNGTRVDRYSGEDYQCLANKGYYNFSLIPFENVDGLTVDEAIEIIDAKDIVFIAYTQADVSDLNSGKAMIKIEMSIRQYFNNLAQYTGTIESVVGSELEYQYYHGLNSPSQQRAIRCFFERYLDYSYEKTTERIKQLEKSK